MHNARASREMHPTGPAACLATPGAVWSSAPQWRHALAGSQAPSVNPHALTACLAHLTRFEENGLQWGHQDGRRTCWPHLAPLGPVLHNVDKLCQAGVQGSVVLQQFCILDGQNVVDSDVDLQAGCQSLKPCSGPERGQSAVM